MREQTYFLTVNQGFGHRCQYHLGAHNFFVYILYTTYIFYNKKCLKYSNLCIIHVKSNKVVRGVVVYPRIIFGSQ